MRTRDEIAASIERSIGTAFLMLFVSDDELRIIVQALRAAPPEAVPTAEALAAARYIMDNARDYGERETILANEIVRLGMNKREGSK